MKSGSSVKNLWWCVFKVRRERNSGHICAENDENMLEVVLCERFFCWMNKAN